ncbi:MAG: hypothetical protein D6781_13275 [Verrucomicrobia bacterium]|nr:MAG: hypothetical protein D6781_13275 [Verrucomicrobiota bacterium]
MDNEQAKFVLGASRPSGRDDERPEVAEALSRAATDADLCDWLARERASDAAIARKMRELEPPAELRSRLLIGTRTSRRKRPLWKRWSIPMGLAAALFLAVGVAWWLLPPPGHMVDQSAPTLAAWQRSCVGIFSNPLFSLDYLDDDYRPLEDYLVRHGARVAGRLPFADGITSALGCSVLEWRGARVSLACFHSRTGELVHLFTMPAHYIEQAPPLQPVYRAQVDAFATITWQQDDLVVMVASRMPQETLDAIVEDRSERITAWVAPHAGSIPRA